MGWKCGDGGGHVPDGTEEHLVDCLALPHEYRPRLRHYPRAQVGSHQSRSLVLGGGGVALTRVLPSLRRAGVTWLLDGYSPAASDIGIRIE